MNIAYHGFCLAEGLKALGTTLLPLVPDKTINIHEALARCKATHGQPHMVLVEFLGNYPWKTDDLPSILHSDLPFVIYAADAPLNMFYLQYLLTFFDYVFVDQRASAHALRQKGIDAHWLPLCVDSACFRPKSPKQHGISFVGRTNKERLKRQNILHVLTQAFPQKSDFAIFQDLRSDEMQDVFAASQATLNENLFDGLTWRVLQALASGTLLLTEHGADSLDALFTNNEDLVSYTPSTLVPLAQDILQHPQKYAHIAKRGQAKCRQYHTATVRVQELWQCLCDANTIPWQGTLAEHPPHFKKNAYFIRKKRHILATQEGQESLNEHHSSDSQYTHSLHNEQEWYAACATFHHVQRFGGSYVSAMTRLHALTHEAQPSLLLAQAHHMLGVIHAGRAADGHMSDLAEAHFHSALATLAHLAKTDAAMDDESSIEQNDAQHMDIRTQKVLTSCALCVLNVRQKAYAKAAYALENASAHMQHISRTHIKLLFPRHRWPLDSPSEVAYKKIEASLLFATAQIYAHLGHIFELGYQKTQHALPNTAIALGLAAWRIGQNTSILDFLLPLVRVAGVTAQLLPEFLAACAAKKVSKTQEKHLMALAHEVYYTQCLA